MLNRGKTRQRPFNVLNRDQLASEGRLSKRSILIVAGNGSADHIQWIEAEIVALRESISLTRSLLLTKPMSVEGMPEAEQFILEGEQKIMDLNTLIARYRQFDDGTRGAVTLTPVSDKNAAFGNLAHSTGKAAAGGRCAERLKSDPQCVRSDKSLGQGL